MNSKRMPRKTDASPSTGNEVTVSVGRRGPFQLNVGGDCSREAEHCPGPVCTLQADDCCRGCSSKARQYRCEHRQAPSNCGLPSPRHAWPCVRGMQGVAGLNDRGSICGSSLIARVTFPVSRTKHHCCAHNRCSPLGAHAEHISWASPISQLYERRTIPPALPRSVTHVGLTWVEPH